MDDARLWSLAEACATKSVGRSLHFEDIRQECAIAGFKALQRFDPSKKMAVEVYVWRAMQYAVTDYWRTALWRKRSQGSAPIERGTPLSIEELYDVRELHPLVFEAGFERAEVEADADALMVKLCREMSPEGYELVRRHYFEGVTQEDLGRQFGVSGSRMSQRVKAARNEARAIIGLTAS